jgi:U3 small nucleolar RNA-associated protein 10
LREFLDVLSMAIERHPRSAMATSIASLSAIFLGVFDLRRILQSSETSFAAFSVHLVDEIEIKVNDLALKFTRKLKDAALEPMFTQLMDWTATGPSPQDDLGRRLRQQSVYSFLADFFDDAQSPSHGGQHRDVTGYASYMTDGAVAILKTVDPRSSDDRKLWTAVLRTLTKCFEHDQTSYWQAPAHFALVAPVLTAQILHAPTTTSSVSSMAMTDLLSSTLTPAIVGLAAAANSADHHKELNGAILRHLRAEQAGVRLAAVKCQQALAERLEESWLLTTLEEMLPYISELQDDDDEVVEREVHRWIVGIEGVLDENLDDRLQ